MKSVKERKKEEKDEKEDIDKAEDEENIVEQTPTLPNRNRPFLKSRYFLSRTMTNRGPRPSPARSPHPSSDAVGLGVSAGRN